mmetsp:Transcript_113548/g.218549  ORF Transcript_113548/g.218549 Transcript_113548/m.218549 type:complete len:761 (-) Transcript_113548:52-2334(-)
MDMAMECPVWAGTGEHITRVEAAQLLKAGSWPSLVAWIVVLCCLKQLGNPLTGSFGYMLYGSLSVWQLFNITNCFESWIVEAAKSLFTVPPCKCLQFLYLCGLLGAPFYSFILCWNLWTVSRKPFHTGGKKRFLQDALYVSLYAIAGSLILLNTYEEIEGLDDAPRCLCQRSYLSTWNTHQIARIWYIAGLVFVLQAYWYVPMFNDSLTKKQQISMAMLRRILLLEGVMNAVIPNLSIFANMVSGSSKIRYMVECFLLGFTSFIVSACWGSVALYINCKFKSIQKEDQDQGHEISDDFRKKIIGRISEGIRKSAQLAADADNDRVLSNQPIEDRDFTDMIELEGVKEEQPLRGWFYQYGVSLLLVVLWLIYILHFFIRSGGALDMIGNFLEISLAAVTMIGGVVYEVGSSFGASPYEASDRSLSVKAAEASDFRVQELAPRVFHALRSRIFKLDKFKDSFQEAFSGGGFTEGKSGAFMYFTKDKEYIVKTATDEEFSTLKRFIRPYYEHMQEASQRHGSLINPMLGAFQLTFGAQYVRVIIIRSVFDKKGPSVDQRFDLKGSWYGRTSKKPKKKKPWDVKYSSRMHFKDSGVRKDLDVAGPLLLDREVAKKMGQALRNDSEFLAKSHIMDYSLLIGVHIDSYEVREEGGWKKRFTAESNKSLSAQPASRMEGPTFYYIGIIDVLQEFTLRKKLEYFGRAYLCGQGHGVSCVPPHKYAKRFQDNIVGPLIEVKKDDGEESEELNRVRYVVPNSMKQPLLSC